MNRSSIIFAMFFTLLISNSNSFAMNKKVFVKNMYKNKISAGFRDSSDVSIEKGQQKQLVALNPEHYYRHIHISSRDEDEIGWMNYWKTEIPKIYSTTLVFRYEAPDSRENFSDKDLIKLHGKDVVYTLDQSGKLTIEEYKEESSDKEKSDQAETKKQEEN
jgi:hypothetical protein